MDLFNFKNFKASSDNMESAKKRKKYNLLPKKLP